jgi:hypothetical protein
MLGFMLDAVGEFVKALLYRALLPSPRADKGRFLTFQGDETRKRG